MGRDLVRGLRTREMDLLTVAQSGRRGLSDDEQLAFATSQGRAASALDPETMQDRLEFLTNWQE